METIELRNHPKFLNFTIIIDGEEHKHIANVLCTSSSVILAKYTSNMDNPDKYIINSSDLNIDKKNIITGIEWLYTGINLTEIYLFDLFDIIILYDYLNIDKINQYNFGVYLQDLFEYTSWEEKTSLALEFKNKYKIYELYIEGNLQLFIIDTIENFFMFPDDYKNPINIIALEIIYEYKMQIPFSDFVMNMSITDINIVKKYNLPKVNSARIKIKNGKLRIYIPKTIDDEYNHLSKALCSILSKYKISIVS